MNRKKTSLTLWIAIVSIFCFMGLTQSNFDAFKITVSEYPWPWDDYDYNNYTVWDEEIPLVEIGAENLYTWQHILDYGNKNKADLFEYSYDWLTMRKFIEQNIFTFTRAGLVREMIPLSYDLNFDLDENTWVQRPNALVIKRLMLDKGNDAIKQKVIKNIIQLLKDPQTKKLWEEQKAEFLDWNSYALESNNEFMVQDYTYIQAADYEESLAMALGYFRSVIRQVEHNDKVMLSRYRNWIIVREVEGICNFLKDTSAFKCYSLCYRLGKDGCSQLDIYFAQVQKELEKP